MYEWPFAKETIDNLELKYDGYVNFYRNVGFV